MSEANPNDTKSKEEGSRRNSVRLTTVYGARVCQSGRAFGCVVSDVSVSGAKVKLKEPNDRRSIVDNQSVQLIFDRLGEYKALNGTIAWLSNETHILGVSFSDDEKIRNRVISKLMPNRWNLVHNREKEADQA